MDDRILSLNQLLGNCLCCFGIQSGLLGLVAVHVSTLEAVGLNLTREHIHGNGDQNRTGASALSQTECLIQNFRESFRTIYSPCSLYEGLVDIVLAAVAVHVNFLMRVLAVVVAGNITGDYYHGDGVKCCVCNTGGRIGQARAKVADNNACLMCNTSVAVSCGSCDLLMTNADVAQLGGTAESIQHSDYSVAAKTEHVLDAATL